MLRNLKNAAFRRQWILRQDRNNITVFCEKWHWFGGDDVDWAPIWLSCHAELELEWRCNAENGIKDFFIVLTIFCYFHNEPVKEIHWRIHPQDSWIRAWKGIPRKNKNVIILLNSLPDFNKNKFCQLNSNKSKKEPGSGTKHCGLLTNLYKPAEAGLK